jgi:tetratricopeptide (TPR) repeat protein
VLAADRAGELNALTHLGGAYRLHGRYEAAMDCYRQVLKLARRLGHRNSELEAQYGFGQTELATGRPDRALVHHRQALALAEDLDQSPDQSPDQSRAHDGLARAHHALGEPEQARGTGGAP